MHIQVSGKQIDLSDALKHRVNTHLGNLAERYFDTGLQAQVTFGKARSFFTCDINVKAARGLILRGEGEAADANAAFDDAAEHIAKRLRRYHKRVTTHARSTTRQEQPERARSYVLQPVDDHEPGDASPTLPQKTEEEETFATIIAEQPADIPVLSVGEAVMRLDLAGQNFLLFRNTASRHISLVYRRDDGNIGWLDTAPLDAPAP
ncbi:ribosome hibernation-promoting factor, HPF/YfiA family [Acetobacter okinawensis]|uniref:ribosome hibernation-promoting factor, HPF/YfiA family n=1 Tax=Acetobacter okinawensis TaxID=1076594 RepID=UPI001BA808A7|nr:ribosome-associated translation inhibitor RaiA [Acetobacter okinawensis]MBS0966758.1 ribosome-associated translation inhibitor RaiA [Acetobacter okinawensis]